MFVESDRNFIFPVRACSNFDISTREAIFEHWTTLFRFIWISSEKYAAGFWHQVEHILQSSIMEMKAVPNRSLLVIFRRLYSRTEDTSDSFDVPSHSGFISRGTAKNHPVAAGGL